jgi:hypothetical protein
MDDLVQVKATIPRPLKRRLFAALAWRDEKFSRWLCAQMQGWLQGAEDSYDERCCPLAPQPPQQGAPIAGGACASE